MDKKRFDKIKARCEAGLPLEHDISALLNVLKETQIAAEHRAQLAGNALVEMMAAEAGLVDCEEALRETIKDRKYFEAEVKRLRDALSRLHSQFGVGRCDVCGARCDVCSDNKQHHDGCPFAILEEGEC